ncbi:DUF2254 family protein [Robbsia sp. KACC 23696]|uniref:DUF2254 family protein n=1 Tax=Robbsia sp. KACC 23696 TaxID=3149231 RepID=UPI00325B6EAC
MALRLQSLIRVGETTDRVKEATLRAIAERKERPYLGGQPFPVNGVLPMAVRHIYPVDIGYVQHIDMPALARLSENPESRIYLHAVPGTFAEHTMPLASVIAVDEDDDGGVRAAFSIGVRRSYEQDPRFGISVLTEIASRALLPAVNDPGTAIDIIGRGIRVFSAFADTHPTEVQDEHDCSRVVVHGLNVQDMFDDFLCL